MPRGWREKSLIKNEKRKNIEWIKCQRLSIIYDDCNKIFLFVARPTSLARLSFMPHSKQFKIYDFEWKTTTWIYVETGEKGSKKGFFLKTLSICRICVRQRKKCGGFINLVQGSRTLTVNKNWMFLVCASCDSIESFFSSFHSLSDIYYRHCETWNVVCRTFFYICCRPQDGLKRWERGGSGGKWWR